MEKTDRPLTAAEAKKFNEHLAAKSVEEMIAWIDWAEGKLAELTNDVAIRDSRIAQLKRKLRSYEEGK